MNSFEIEYTGNLRTAAKHLDSGEIIFTDAPKDNHGLGKAFSPTDMVCSALASCMLTIMAIAVEKNGISIIGTKIIAKKTMGDNPRMIAQIDTNIFFPSNYDKKTKTILERSAFNCPVHKSLSDKIVKNISFNYQK
jgi:putative redox protein